MIKPEFMRFEIPILKKGFSSIIIRFHKTNSYKKCSSCGEKIKPLHTWYWLLLKFKSGGEMGWGEPLCSSKCIREALKEMKIWITKCEENESSN